MKKQYTTVLIVSDDNTSTQSFNVESKHFRRLKIYAISACCILSAVIIFSISLLVGIKLSMNERAYLEQKVKTMENDVKLLDSLNIKTKINNIENKIFDINKFLKERGIGKDNYGIGGDSDSSRSPVISAYDFYETETNELFINLNNIPIGYPIYGEIKSDYGYRANPYSGRSSEFHKGIDFKANTGDTVRCTADGFVESADWDKGYGKCVTLMHSYGFECKYGHLTEFNVVQGQKVKAGDIIGFVGNTGRSTGPHLHYEIRRFGSDINPHNYLTLN